MPRASVATSFCPASSESRRVDRALNAVPAAVLTTLVAPSLMKGDWREALTLAFVAAATLRLPGLAVFAAGWALIIGFRQIGG